MTDARHNQAMSDLPQGDIPPLTLGIRLYMAMQFGEISREQMADQIGVSTATISRWVHNNFSRPPSRGNLTAWAMTCGVRPEWLIDGIGEMPTPPAGLRAVTTSEPAVPKRPGKARTRRNSVYNSAGRVPVAA